MNFDEERWKPIDTIQSTLFFMLSSLISFFLSIFFLTGIHGRFDDPFVPIFPLFFKLLLPFHDFKQIYKVINFYLFNSLRFEIIGMKIINNLITDSAIASLLGESQVLILKR
jgi:hypothetical protein